MRNSINRLLHITQYAILSRITFHVSPQKHLNNAPEAVGGDFAVAGAYDTRFWVEVYFQYLFE